MDELRFDDRVVVVTGGGRGIGRSHAIELAQRGAHVVVADFGVDVDGTNASASPADGVVAEIVAAGGSARACFASVADERGAQSIVDTALDQFGRLDALINNAGIMIAAPFEDLSAEQFGRVMDVHLLGTVNVTHAAWSHFKAVGSGRVVNTTSEAMLGGIPGLSAYGSAKGAIFALTRNLATETTGTDVRINALAPRSTSRMAEAESRRIAPAFGLDEAGQAAVHATMPATMATAGALYLAHESCALNGEVIQAGMGTVSRLAVVRSRGLTGDRITAEDIAANLGTIMDLTDPEVTESTSIVP